MDALFVALADPTRRAVLASLRDIGPMSLNTIAERFPISRQAVAKHMDVLGRAGLVEVSRHGRERIHALVPEPLQDVEQWLRPYAAAWDRRLVALQAHLEENE